MALLSAQNADNGLGDVSFVAAAAGGDQVPAGIRAGAWNLPVLLLVNNAGVGSITVTPDGHEAVTVPAASTAVIPVHRVQWSSPVSVTYSGVASVTVAAVRVAPGVQA